MKKRLVALSLLLSLAGGAAVADGQHYATASTKQDAKRLATAQARATAKDLAQCYHPARQVGECQPVEGGFRCRAETSADYRTCKRAGWVNEYSASAPNPAKYIGWRSADYSRWPLDYGYQGPSPSKLYGVYLAPDAGPPAPTPFPNN